MTTYMHADNFNINNLFGEQWRSVAGYEGIYQVSSFGRIKRLAGKSCLKDRLLKQSKFGIGYRRVVLSINAEKKSRPSHILVAQQFIPNPNNYPIVMHNDDDPENNNVYNLIWGTQKQNIQDCHKKGRAANNLPKLSGKNHPCFGKHLSYKSRKKMSDTKKKITDQQIEMAKSLVASGISQRQAAKKSGLSGAYLCQLIGGYKRL